MRACVRPGIRLSCGLSDVLVLVLVLPCPALPPITVPCMRHLSSLTNLLPLCLTLPGQVQGNKPSALPVCVHVRHTTS